MPVLAQRFNTAKRNLGMARVYARSNELLFGEDHAKRIIREAQQEFHVVVSEILSPVPVLSGQVTWT